ncbi:MAG: CPBP family intramembrane metalloprotease [Candidatus Marinimicrobia bacterium]|nr:CPBP family intramembrane metalloprotease [Candidatus Neomarinimicrobiota bacterium]MBL7023691.1 CPBP family intramembrane metalloprotease [Candidatus Neomarinimicrobiota bacterium]
MNSENYKRYFPTITQSIILCMLIVGVTIILSFSLILIVNPSNLKIDILVWINVPIFAIVLFIGWMWSKKPLHNYFQHKRVPLHFISVSIMTALGIIILIGDIENLIQYFFPISNNVLDMFEMLLSGGSGVLAAIIMASVTEEVFFRGMILPGLARNYGKIAGIFITAFLFGIIHLNPWQFLPAFIMGIYIGWIYLTTRNIWLCIGIHSFNNAIAAIPQYLGMEIQGLVYDVREGVQFNPFWLNVIGVVLCVGGIVILKSYTNKNNNIGV